MFISIYALNTSLVPGAILSYLMKISTVQIDKQSSREDGTVFRSMAQDLHARFAGDSR